jgi:hypothetical protein
MQFSKSLLSAAVIASFTLYLVGCSSGDSSTVTVPADVSPPDIHDGHDHGHDHAHGHSHEALGPNQGHLLELGDEQFHLEWVHDDESGKLTVFVLDSAAKELVPIAAESLKLEKVLGERTDTFDLVAVDRQGDPPRSARFEIVDKSLIEALKLVGDGVEASIAVDVNGQPFTAKFSKHEHHHKH